MVWRSNSAATTVRQSDDAAVMVQQQWCATASGDAHNDPPCLNFFLLLPLTLATAVDDFEGWIDDAVRRYKDQSAFMMNADVTRPALDGAVRDVEANRTVITVRKDGAGDFKTITGAVRSIATGIGAIGPGVYREKVTVDRARPYVSFYGDPNNPPRITYGATARKVGTWSSATVIVESDHFVAANIIFEDCHMESVAKGVTAITAQARTRPTEHSGFSFVRCSINGTGNATLSRAWKQSSRVVFLYTYMGRLIQPAGWDDKGHKSRDK
ncbi:putative pectinesterase 63 [Acorus calamus]|uniref:pectinesterase n=1 Tax=Acorus calamus TaxID=4465 RepID=A0AAV9E2M9_ACOCL|nr:putative pectinesterase 63 [Acorus calamus]